MKTALYARVSTRDREQNPETQLLKLRAWASNLGHDATEYVDLASAADFKRRTEWRRLGEEITRGQVRRVAVLRLDRAFRSSADLHVTLTTWDTLGVEFVCITQPMIGTANPMARFMLGILGAAAELERSLTVERVHEGLDRARAEGKRLGRPPKYGARIADTIRDLRAGGMSDRAISSELHIPRATVQRLGGPKPP